jgi:hypothetical protein
VEELFDPGALLDTEVAALVPRMGFVLDDISRAADEEILRRTLTPEASLVLWALRDARNGPTLLASLMRWGPVLAELARTREEAVRTIVGYILAVAEALSAEELRLAVRAAAPQAEDAIMTAAEPRRSTHPAACAEVRASGAGNQGAGPFSVGRGAGPLE